LTGRPYCVIIYQIEQTEVQLKVRKLLIIITAVILLTGFSSEVSASWSQLFITDDKPNLLNLWSNKEMQTVDYHEGTWFSWQSSDDLRAQGFTTEYEYNFKDIYVTGTWIDSHPEPLYLAAQEIHYDFSKGEIIDTFYYGLYWDGANWDGGGIKIAPDDGSDYAGYFALAGGQSEPTHPIPEPQSIFLFSTGLAGLFFLKLNKNKNKNKKKLGFINY
jgi:hypothetical protein